MHYHAITETEKQIVSGWQYPGAYAIYNSTPYGEQIRTRSGFANPENRYYSFYDEETLVSYINLRERDGAVYLGIAVAPDLCGRGYGQQIVPLACELARETYPGKDIRMEVRSWNARAIRCYEKAGFRIAGDPVTKTTPLGAGEFYTMVWDGNHA